MRALIPCLLLLAASPAHGFKRSQTNGGLPLWWDTLSPTYFIDSDGSDDLCSRSGAVAERSQACLAALATPEGCPATCEFEAIHRGAHTWEGVVCEGDPASRDLLFGGFTEDAGADFTLSGSNQNVLVWIEAAGAWPHSRAALGVTSATYDARTGRVMDADVELNGVDFTFTTTDSALQVRTDVQNTVTHEFGHFLGLDHTPSAGATMEANAPDGETRKRSLSPDDADGLCAVGPPEDLPAQGASVEDGWECGSSIAGGRPAGALPWLLLLSVLGARRKPLLIAQETKLP